MAEICRALNISQSQFSGMVEPFLRQLNFMETLASVRAISEQYVKSQLQHISESSVRRKDINRAVDKVSEALMELEKAKARKAR
jgi:hypothetical protein